MLHTLKIIFGLVVMANIFYFIIILALKCLGIVEWRSSKKPTNTQTEEVVHLVNHPIKKTPAKTSKKPKKQPNTQKPQPQSNKIPSQPLKTPGAPQPPFQPDISDVSDSISTISGHAAQPQTESASSTIQQTANQNQILDDLSRLSFFSKSPTNQQQSEEEANSAIDKLTMAELQMLMNLKDLRDLQLYQRMQEIRQLKEMIKAETQSEIEKQVNQRIQELMPQLQKQKQQQQPKQTQKKQKTK